MYASYNMLYNDCGQTPFTAYTDRSRFCSSLPIQRQVRKSIYSDKVFPLNVPCTHNCEIRDKDCQYKCAMTTTPPPQPTKKTAVEKKTKKENFQLSNQDYEALLPVMDPQFNLREICKQCILLEDHLCHDEKRCFDCCIKHFLTIEALAEEAITLDKTSQHADKIQKLPTQIRNLQAKWHQDPEKNSQAVSQELRKIRKDFQIDSFDIVFKSSCKDGVCKITKSS